jgi:hypothetical protein
MNRQLIRFYGTLAACFVGFGAIGGLLGRALHGHPTSAAVTLGLMIVAGAVAWWWLIDQRRGGDHAEN